MPTRGMIPLRVHVSLRDMAWLPNTPRAHLEVENMEVAAAYNEGISMILGNPNCEGFPFIWTYEEDNIQPKNVFFKLFDAMWTCIDCGEPMPSEKDGSPVEPWECANGHRGLDAVAGLYYTKSEPPMPQAYGNPRSGELEFRPRDVEAALELGEVMEVNGIAMGCTLWRRALFEKVSKPWFKTLTGGEDVTIGAYTQDLYLARKAKEELGMRGTRFAVHCGVLAGHLDVTTGQVY